jgi:large subunit ribosomal protein L16
MKEAPKKFIYGRIFRVKLKKNTYAVSNLNLSYYTYGIKALDIGKLQVFHVKAIMKTIKKFFKKELKLRINIPFNVPVTKKPLEVRMGKGKGERDH